MATGTASSCAWRGWHAKHTSLSHDAQCQRSSTPWRPQTSHPNPSRYAPAYTTLAGAILDRIETRLRDTDPAEPQTPDQTVPPGSDGDLHEPS